jgi:digalactosyldiacylglycerol synthase
MTSSSLQHTAPCLLVSRAVEPCVAIPYSNHQPDNSFAESKMAEKEPENVNATADVETGTDTTPTNTDEGSEKVPEAPVITDNDSKKKDGDEVDHDAAGGGGAVEEGRIAAVSDLSDPKRRICIVTTAGLPWRTGTAVNPLARALYLTRGRPTQYVTLMIPWLESKDEQAQVYGQTTFDTPDEQEEFVRKYSKERVNCAAEAENLRIAFYPASYNELFGSIFATVDICALIPKDEADIAILEEPEHLNWFRVVPKVDKKAGAMDAQEDALMGWPAKFSYVVGILHTNYSAYMRQYGLGVSLVSASALQALSSVVVRAYTHRLIRLSDTLPELDKAKEVTCNVHGVRSEFFDPPKEEQVESEDANADEQDDGGFTPQPIYFIGKTIWAKGFDKLLEIEDMYRKEVGEYFPIDVYGSGGDSAAITRAFLGRSGLSRGYSSTESLSNSNDSDRQQQTDEPSPQDQTASLVFSRKGSLRGQVEEGVEIPSDAHVVEIQVDTPTNTPRSSTPGAANNSTAPTAATPTAANPEHIISHLGGKTLETGTSVSRAIAALSERLAKLGHRMTFTEECREGGSNVSDASGSSEPTKFVFDPPKTRYELRRHPIPARFLGVKDHALLRDIPGHKVFINLSITEVLCTTTAEALAMGKFVIIPKHREYPKKDEAKNFQPSAPYLLTFLVFLFFLQLQMNFSFNFQTVCRTKPKKNASRR